MKKTMLALMATVGLAFGAKAEPLNKADFESYEVGSFNYELSDTADTESDCYWAVTNAAADAQGTITAYEVAPAENNNKYLAVDTNGEILYRSVSALGNTHALEEGTSIGTGLFLDAEVKFTATEEASVTPGAGDKLIVWLYADEEGTTNLMVTAGVYDEDHDVYTPTAFPITNVGSDSAEIVPDSWYRLTVKAAEVNSKTVFTVYIDGKQASSGETSVFSSLVDSEADGGKAISAVGFQGTGALDNVVWTREDPFPVVEPDSFTVNVTLTDDKSQVGGWTLNDADKTGEEEATADVLVDTEAEIKVTITVYTAVTVAATVNSVDVPAENITSAPGEEEESTVYTITIDGSSYVDGDTVELAITVTADEEPPTPETDVTEIGPDGTGYIADETGEAYTKEDVEEMVSVVAPNDGSLTPAAKAAYDGYFTKNATYNTETKKWEVTVTLDTDTLEAEVDDAVEAALEAVVGDAETKAVEIPAGFYYKIEHGATVGLTGEPLTGTSTGSVAMPALGEDAGFFKVSVGTASFEE